MQIAQLGDVFDDLFLRQHRKAVDALSRTADCSGSEKQGSNKARWRSHERSSFPIRMKRGGCRDDRGREQSGGSRKTAVATGSELTVRTRCLRDCANARSRRARNKQSQKPRGRNSLLSPLQLPVRHSNSAEKDKPQIVQRPFSGRQGKASQRVLRKRASP